MTSDLTRAQLDVIARLRQIGRPVSAAELDHCRINRLTVKHLVAKGWLRRSERSGDRMPVYSLRRPL